MSIQNSFKWKIIEYYQIVSKLALTDFNDVWTYRWKTLKKQKVNITTSEIDTKYMFDGKILFLTLNL